MTGAQTRVLRAFGEQQATPLANLLGLSQSDLRDFLRGGRGEDRVQVCCELLALGDAHHTEEVPSVPGSAGAGPRGSGGERAPTSNSRGRRRPLVWRPFAPPLQGRKRLLLGRLALDVGHRNGQLPP
jgi:hypothetical protein